jgi:hypothetical protein
LVQSTEEAVSQPLKTTKWWIIQSISGLLPVVRQRQLHWHLRSGETPYPSPKAVNAVLWCRSNPVTFLRGPDVSWLRSFRSTLIVGESSWCPWDIEIRQFHPNILIVPPMETSMTIDFPYVDRHRVFGQADGRFLRAIRISAPLFVAEPRS